MRSRLATALIGSAAVAALTLACHGSALLRSEQYAYRDAAHYYYPLHARVQQLWSAGRWPLWDPSENAGMPLLGNPTAAVLYPAKLIFAAVPYPLAARLYIIAHNLLAFGTMVALLRSWGTGAVGSALGGLAYAFGAPILFQYSNIIYLVGAAWAPLGMLAADRWVRLGNGRAVPGLAVVLAMETLGGDPETAYLTGGFAVAYVAGLAIHRNICNCGYSPIWIFAGIFLALTIWTGATLAIAARASSWRGPTSPLGLAHPLPWMPWVGPAVGLVWVLMGLGVLGRWRRERKAVRRFVLGPSLTGLVLAAVLAAGLSAAQLLPVLEFTAQSARVAGEVSHEVFSFSLEPSRLIGLVWPNAGGTMFEGNHSWLDAVALFGRPSKDWVPSLYLGGLTLVLALATVRFRGASPWQIWIGAVGLFSLAASVGEFASPLAVARALGAWPSVIGGHDPIEVPVIRLDGNLRDGDGGIYWALTTFLPGFKAFRFPAKFLTFVAIAVGCLAGRGWDAVASGNERTRRSAIAWASALLALSMVAWVAATVCGRGYLARIAEESRSTLGPLDVETSVRDLRAAIVHGAVVLGLVLALVVSKVGRGRFAGAFALILMTVDLATANAGLVLTVPQRLFEEPPAVLALIQKSERDHPDDGPFRVHRMTHWEPLGWAKDTSAGRTSRFLGWERGTLQPKYGIPLGVEYTMTIGGVDPRDYLAFFRAYLGEASTKTTRTLGVASDQKIAIYSRFAFDLWNTRYFVLPFYPNRWNDKARGFAAFLDRTEQLHPDPAEFLGEDGRAKRRDWVDSSDFQVRRNLAAHPRAWVTRRAVELRDPAGQGRDPADPAGIDEILFPASDPSGDPTLATRDPRSVAWLEPGRVASLSPFLDGRPSAREESIRIERQEADRVELRARLDRPGLVVLADAYYPGWTLTIDGQPAGIERANRIMRAAPVGSGDHTLVFRYNPASFRVGLVVTGVSLAALGISILLARKNFNIHGGQISQEPQKLLITIA